MSIGSNMQTPVSFKGHHHKKEVDKKDDKKEKVNQKPNHTVRNSTLVGGGVVGGFGTLAMFAGTKELLLLKLGASAIWILGGLGAGAVAGKLIKTHNQHKQEKLDKKEDELAEKIAKKLDKTV